MPRRTVPSRLAALTALLLPFYGHAADLEVYRPVGRPAAELAPLVSAAIEPDGGAIADPGSGRLILRGTPAAIREARDLLRVLDTPPSTFRIESGETHLRDLERRGLSVEGWIEAGPFRIGTLRAPPGLLRIGIGADRIGRESHSSAVVTVNGGRPAEIWTGADHREALPGAPLDRLDAVRWVPARRGFRVVPHPLGDGAVDLDIALLSEDLKPGGNVRRAGATTRIRLEPGRTAVIGEVGGEEEQAAAHLPATRSRRYGRSQRLLWVRVEEVTRPGR